MAAATCSAEPSPCTFTGHTSTRRGKRSCSRCRMSRMTAPVGEVTTPITSGSQGSNCLRASSNRPSARELPLALLHQRHQRADAGGLDRLDHDLVFRRARIGRELAGGDDLEPFLRLEPHPGVGELPDHRLDLGALVLQREIAVAGGVRPAKAGDFAADADMAIGVLHRPLQRGGQLGDGEFGRVDQVFGSRHRQLIRAFGGVAAT